MMEDGKSNTSDYSKEKQPGISGVNRIKLFNEARSIVSSKYAKEDGRAAKIEFPASISAGGPQRDSRATSHTRATIISLRSENCAANVQAPSGQMIELSVDRRHLNYSSKPSSRQPIGENSFDIKQQQQQQVSSCCLSESKQVEHDKMAATLKLIGSINGARPLRQITIVGQLNHSTRRGLLMVAIQLAFFFIGLLILASGNNNSVHCALWPFASSRANSSSEESMPLLTGTSFWHSKRSSAKSGSEQALARPSREASTSPAAPPLAQQFHYFWNHDQIDQKTMADEAQRVLAEAQHQTDLSLIGGQSVANSSKPLATSNRQDSAPLDQMSVASTSSIASLASAPNSISQQQPQAKSQQSEQMVFIPPAIQQQLTGIVLQLQRQQQMSMMMQPRFPVHPAMMAAAAAEQAAQRRLSTPAMGKSLLEWPTLSMAASSQQPVVALPPMPQAESAMQPRANIAGVPVYGPYMVGPAVARPPLQMVVNQPVAGAMPGLQAAMAAAQLQQYNQALASAAVAQPSRARSAPAGQSPVRQLASSSRSSFASSLLRGRKSWPFSAFHSNTASGQREQQQTASSTLRASVLPPPPLTMQQQQQQQQSGAQADTLLAETARALAAALPPESLSLIDLTSNQLANAILGQMSMRSAQQRIMSALAAATAIATSNPQTSSLAVSSVPPVSDPIDLASSSSMISSRSFGGSVQAQPEQVFSLLASSRASPPKQSFGHQQQQQQQQQQQNPLQPPYLLNADNLQQAELGPAQNFDLGQQWSSWPNSSTSSSASPFFAPATASQFGIRLKRRHLSQAAGKQLSTVAQHAKLLEQASRSAPEPMSSLFDSNAPMSILTRPATVQRVGQRDTARRMDDSSKWPKRIVKKDSVDVSITKQMGQQVHFTVASEPIHQAPQIHVDAEASGRIFDEPTTTTTTTENGGHQLRRLKRSLPEIKQGNRSSRSLKSFSSGWKSMEVSSDKEKDALEHESWIGSTTVSGSASLAAPRNEPQNLAATLPVKSSSWTGSWGAWRQSAPHISDAKSDADLMSVATSAPMLRRQAELSQASSTTIGGKQTSSSGGVAPKKAADQQAAELIQQARQDRALKIKRVTAGASVLHHASSSSSSSKTNVANQSAPLADAAKRQALTRAIIAQRQSSLSAKSEQQPAMEAVAHNQAADPMVAAIAESARVVNYFANVDNESSSPSSAPVVSSTTTMRPQLIQQQPQQQQQQSISGQPQINVGFAAPAKQHSSSQQQSVLVGRLNGTQQGAQLSGNGQQAAAASHQYTSGAHGAAPADFSSASGASGAQYSSGTQQQQQQLQQQQQQQQQFLAPTQSSALASSADISSAATGPQAYAVQNSAAGVSSDAHVGAPALVQQTQQMVQVPNSLTRQQAQQMQSSASSRFNSATSSPFGVVQGANLLNALLGIDQTQRSSSPGTTIMTATRAQSQQTSPRKPVVGSMGLSLVRNNNNNYYHTQSAVERTPSADQSSSYGEEVSAPNGNQPMFTNEQLQMFNEQQEQQQLQQQHQEQQRQQQQQEQQQHMEAQTANGMPPGFSDNSFGTRNQQQQQQQQQAQMDSSYVDQSSTPAMIELNRYTQQQQQQRAAGQLAQQQLFSSAPALNVTLSADSPQQFIAPPPPTLPQSADSSPSSGLDSSSLYSSAGQFSLQQQQQQQQAEAQMLAASQNQQMSSNGQQHEQAAPNWQQLQSLGNAVSKFNSQLQQLDEIQRQQSNILQSTGQLQPQQQQFTSQTPSSLAERHFFTSNFDSSSSLPTSGAGLSLLNSLYASGSSQPNLSGAVGGPVDEEAAANAAAAAGIPTYPSAAQLLALQAMQQQQQQHQQHLPANFDFNTAANLLMAGTENRESSGDGENSVGGGTKKKGKKSKGNGTKHVSHHYHFSALGSPLEDPDSQFAQLDFAGSLAAQEQARANRAALAKQKAKKEEEQKQEEESGEENEKPKKKGGFLRRFSLKNLFKRFKKDKKKENQEVEEQNNNSDSQSNSGGLAGGEARS